MTAITRSYHRILRLFGRIDDDRGALPSLLDSVSTDLPLAERVRWLERLIGWVRSAPVNQHEFDRASGALHNARLRFLLQLLGRHPQWETRVGDAIGSLLAETSAFNLLSRAGIGRERGFLSEASDRILRRVLPRPIENRDLGELFLRIFDDPSDAAWVSGLKPETLDELSALVLSHSESGPRISARWREDILTALAALGARVATLGTAPEVSFRAGEVERRMPFLSFNAAIGRLVQEFENSSRSPEAGRNAFIALESCRQQLAAVYDSLETSGASVSLVYTLENIGACLRRADLLLSVVCAPREGRQIAVQRLFSVLVAESVEQQSLIALVKSNLRLVARKIVERTGASGEHYIARNRTEYFAMIRAGLGGGAIMVFTTLAKISISAAHMPLFIEGVFYSINYSLSFLLLQAGGFTLATKQPSVTASALAGKMVEFEHGGEIRELVDEACRMTRTQFAALIGNVIALVPIALAVEWITVQISGKHVVDVAKAKAIVASLHPLESFTVFNAALTGVLLWMSSTAAGWLENSIVYRRIPDALATNRRLIWILGESRSAALGEWTLRNATLIGGNLSLGILMGGVSILGLFVGLPIDVRHVTLSTASLTFGASTLIAAGEGLRFLVFPVIGVLLVGLLNFAVSYSLAFLVAARARALHRGSVRRLLRAMRARFFHRPLDYFFPRERIGSA